MEKVYINKIIPFSSVDGIGNRTSVFLQGCNFKCDYCHNPETQNLCVGCGECIKNCPSGALKAAECRPYNNVGEATCFPVYDRKKCVECDTCIKICKHNASPRVTLMDAKEVYDEIIKNVPYIRGVTISGGECTLHTEFLYELFSLIKNGKQDASPTINNNALTTFIDTNGSYDFFKNEKLLNLTDGFMLDVKAYDNKEHMKLMKYDNEMVLKNLDFLSKIHKLEEVRTVVYEGYDYKNTIINVCEVIKKNNSYNTLYKIIKFRPMGVKEEYKNLITPSDEVFNDLSSIVSEYKIKNIII